MSNPKIACNFHFWEKIPWREALDRMAETGYQGVENLMPLREEYENRIEVGRKILEDRNLSLTGLTVQAEFAHPDRQGTIMKECLSTAGFLRDMKAEWLLLNLGSRETYISVREDYRNLANLLNDLGKQCSDSLVRVAVLNAPGSRVEREEDIDRLLNLLDLEVVTFCPDTAGLAHAGEDPVRILKTYYEGIHHVRLQDYVPDEDHPEGGYYCPLGKGALDFTAIASALRENQNLPWVTVSLDNQLKDAPEVAHEMYVFTDRLFGNEAM
ncbi:MAG: sugar phosphate isomerase/epimerase family protein [bacterium]|jgi:sugar phosphate isomerase/epimerase